MKFLSFVSVVGKVVWIVFDKNWVVKIVKVGLKIRFNRVIFDKRSFVMVMVFLDDIKVIKKVVGVILNDVVMVMCGDVLWWFLDCIGDLFEELLIFVVLVFLCRGD